MSTPDHLPCSPPVTGAADPVRDRPALSPGDVSRIIEMAWEDRTPFEDIEREYGLGEPAVIALMRREMKPSSFRMWRKRMAGRVTKHRALQEERTPKPTPRMRTGGPAARSLLSADGARDPWRDASPLAAPLNSAQGPSAPSLRG